jgi:hypothetical protein
MLFLVLMGLLATTVPARRAAGVNPTVAMGEEQGAIRYAPGND